MTRQFDLRDEREALSAAIENIDSYSIENEYDPASQDLPALLEGAIERVAESSDAITDPHTFDIFRSVFKFSDVVSGTCMRQALDSISSGLEAESETTLRDIDTGVQSEYMSHKTPLEMYAFLLQFFVVSVEKVKAPEEDEAAAPKPRRGRGGKTTGGRTAGRVASGKKTNESWSWISSIPATLRLIGKVLDISTQRIWTTTAERDTFIGCITRPAYHVAENEQYMKSGDIRLGVSKVICKAVKQHNHAFAAQTSIMQHLQFFEHLSESMADCLALLAKDYDYSQLGDEILREIANMNFSGADNKSTRSFAKFLVHFSEVAPRSMLKQISLLINQLDSEAYPIRNAIVEVLGALIVELANTDAGNADNTESANKQITNLYSLLLDRMLDLSSYVRTKVLSVFVKLCDIRSVFPKQRLHVARAAVAALEDKVASVRKGAIVVLIKLTTTHPYEKIDGGLLKRSVFEKAYKEIVEKLQQMDAHLGINAQQLPDAENDQQDNRRSKDDDTMDVDGENPPSEDRKQNEDEMSVDGTAPTKPRQSITIGDIEALDAQKLLEQRETLKLMKKFCNEGINFIQYIESASEIICQLLGSTSKAEVLESIEFFRVAHTYEVETAQEGIKKMLHLIWVKDNSSTVEDGKELKGIRSRLLDCYRSIYFEEVANLEPKAQISRIAKNMIELTSEATLAELTSLEEMMRIMMEDKELSDEVIDKLWQIYSHQRPLPKAQRRGAIVIIGMLAVASRSVLTDRVEQMLKIGLGNLGKHDLMLARYTCVALQRLNGSAKKVKGSLEDKTIRLPMDNVIFRKLQEAIEQPCRSRDWFGLAEQIINTVYALGDHPDVFCNDVIKKLTQRVFGHESRPIMDDPKDPDAMNEDHPAETADPEPKDVGDAFELSKLLFVVGHVAIKHIVYLELVEREWKRQKDEKQAAEKRTNAPGQAPKPGEDLDQVVGNAEDEIGDRMATIRESELLYGPDSLLAIYGPMLVNICGSPHKFKSRTLRAAATLSFSKFLCVSSQFCDQNHRLLFRILETSKSPEIRSNIVIALGDVAVSFSSIIDENSDELYKGLSDSDLVVKKNTLMVLTHLILNGMVKVKGQLGEMAKCIEDEDSRIADLAKLFFKELSTKENAIYNNLPDIISHLSIGQHAVDEETFQKILKHIFTYIEKEKQAENIIEKLCQRFRLSEDPRQWRDIAFCLSLLPYKSERSVKKLTDGLPFYRDKLHEEGVYSKFTEILVKARQNKSPNKPDNELNDFEQILQEHKQQGEADVALEKRVKGKKRAAAKKASRRPPKKAARVGSDEEDDA